VKIGKPIVFFHPFL